jgi:hypothetical protein
MIKTHRGGCHCGAVRFECELDLDPEGQRSEPRLPGPWWTSTFRCNCSWCAKTRFWKALVRAGDFRLLAGEEALTHYRFGAKMIDHVFCRTCGIAPFGSASLDVMGGDFYAINVGCLDDVTAEELAAAPVRYEDGLHDRWDEPPAVTRYL